MSDVLQIPLYKPVQEISPLNLPDQINGLILPKSVRMANAVQTALMTVITQNSVTNRPHDAARDIGQIDGSINSLITCLGVDIILEMIMETLGSVPDDPILLDTFYRQSPDVLKLPEYKNIKPTVNFLGSLDDYIIGQDPEIFQPFGIGLGLPKEVLAQEGSNLLQKLNNRVVVTHNLDIAKLQLYKLARHLGLANRLQIVEIPKGWGYDKAEFIASNQNLSNSSYQIFLEERKGGTEQSTFNYTTLAGYEEQSSCLDIIASGNSMKKAGLEPVIHSPMQGLVAVTNKLVIPTGPSLEKEFSSFAAKLK